MNCMILSAQFWPSFREEKLELPELFQKSLDKYTKQFETLKGNRSLNWKSHLGMSILNNFQWPLSLVSIYITSLVNLKAITKYLLLENLNFTLIYRPGNARIGAERQKT